MKHYLNTDHLSDLLGLAERGLALKNQPPDTGGPGAGRVLTCMYLNPSLRTRLSTEIAASRLGMKCINLEAGSAWKLETEFGVRMDQDKAEHLKEQAMVLSAYSDIIAIRAFPGLKDREEDYHRDFITKFSEYADRPIVNLESGSLHPLQGLADLMTILEAEPVRKPKIVLSWAPHPRQLPQSVANSFSRTIQQAGFDLTIACPEGMELAPEFSGKAEIVHDQRSALEGADFVYTKNWSSYQDYGRTIRADDWIIDAEKMKRTREGKFMHCLPVRRNVVVSDEVLDSPGSLIRNQATNRIFAAQIVLKEILEAL